MVRENVDLGDRARQIAESVLQDLRDLDDKALAEAKDTISDIRDDPTPFLFGILLGVVVGVVLGKAL